MVNSFDYKDYIKRVDDPVEPWAYGQKVGFLLICKNRYPQLSLDDAQKAMTQEMNDSYISGQKLSRQESKESCCGGKKKDPNMAKKGFNFAKALTEHIITGKKHVEADKYIKRLEICKTCPSRNEGFECAECGCYMGIKASWAEQNCKLNKW